MPLGPIPNLLTLLDASKSLRKHSLIATIKSKTSLDPLWTPSEPPLDPLWTSSGPPLELRAYYSPKGPDPFLTPS
eukprot:1060885-Prorocentrum_minimum.AAC.1